MCKALSLLSSTVLIYKDRKKKERKIDRVERAQQLRTLVSFLEDAS